MEKTSFNLSEIQHGMDEKWNQCIEDTRTGNLNSVYAYCKYVKSLYDDGYIGYLVFPNSLAGLFGIEEYLVDANLLEIAHLGADLELPNEHMDGGKEVRISKMKELEGLIDNLPEVGEYSL